MKKLILAVTIISFFIGCANEKKEATSDLKVTAEESPTGPRSATPYLFTDKNNITYLSWTEKTDSANLFKYAKLESGTWSTPTLIASGKT